MQVQGWNLAVVMNREIIGNSHVQLGVEAANEFTFIHSSDWIVASLSIDQLHLAEIELEMLFYRHMPTKAFRVQ